MDELQSLFPIVVKPRWGSGSIGIEIARTEKELLFAYNKCKNLLASSALNKLGNSDNIVFMQEYLVADEFGVDIFNDMTGYFVV